MRWSRYLCLNSLLLAACSSEPSATASQPIAPIPPAVTPADSATQAAALATPQQFLRWYAPRMDSLNSMCLVPAACNSDTADAYVMDFKQVNKYLAALGKGGFTSARYAAGRRAYYQQQADLMRAHPLYDGAPSGLDFDPIIYSQDFDDLPALLKTRPTFLSYTPDSARVGLGLYHEGAVELTLAFRLSRQGQRWVIDNIERVFPGE